MKLYIAYDPEDSAACVGKLQTSLVSLAAWCTKYGMNINVQKCGVLYFGRNNPRSTYTIDNAPVTSSSSLRDLGVIISETLKSNDHCTAIVSKARRLTGLLLRTFKSRKSSVIVPLYKTLIRPLLEYATPSWNTSSKQNAAAIESVQHLVTKRIEEVKHLPYCQRLQVLQLPTLEARRQYFDLLECYKVIHGLIRSTCSHAFSKCRLNTRGCEHKLVSALPTPRLNIRKHYFTERVVDLWNHLPPEIAQAPTYAQFKRALRIHLCV
jgi:ribonucleases P/MRP protein subunit RPP40